VLLTGGTAYVESAQACGLHHLTAEERDPKVTTSYGVGLLLAAAVAAGARRVVVGLGGSATNDGGAGMYAALGGPPLGADGLALPYGGAALAACAGLGGVPALRGAELVLASDVDNPLLGLHGASAVYGPQKGADRADVLLLDGALQTWAEVLVRDLPGCPPDLATLPGGGAAGGLGAAFLALGGRREPGIDMVRRLVGLDGALAEADLVVTGEGSFDFQSLRGKVVSGVAAAALARGIPCLVLAGQVRVGRREMGAAGIDAAYSLAEHAGSVDDALRRPAEALRSLAARVAREWSRT
jgi:glycerate kinase